MSADWVQVPGPDSLIGSHTISGTLFVLVYVDVDRLAELLIERCACLCRVYWVPRICLVAFCHCFTYLVINLLSLQLYYLELAALFLINDSHVYIHSSCSFAVLLFI